MGGFKYKDLMISIGCNFPSWPVPCYCYGYSYFVTRHPVLRAGEAIEHILQ